ncbi:hypothetical protein FRC01_006949, partial [Tulasnella sp. 417]
MSLSLAPPSIPVRFARDFERHSASLQAVLPSPNATSLDDDLSRRIKCLLKAIELPSNLGPQQILADRYCPTLLWDLARRTGLTLRILGAAGRVAQIDTDGSTTSQLIACISSIFEAGLTSGHISSTSLHINRDMIQAAVQAIPRVIDESWLKLGSKVCSSNAPSADDVALLDNFIHLVCIAIKLIECGKVTDSANSTELETLQEPKSEMARSEALEALMLQFVMHRNNSSHLKVLAITSFSEIFGSSIPSLSNVPGCLNEVRSVLKDILIPNDSEGLVNRDRYSPTVDMIHTILSSDQLRAHFQVRGSTQEGSDDYPTATNEENKLFDALSDGYWQWLKGEQDNLSEGDVSTLTIRVLIVTCCLMSLHLSNSLLIFQRSFLPLVARGLLAWQLLGDNALRDNDAFRSSNWQEDLHH